MNQTVQHVYGTCFTNKYISRLVLVTHVKSKRSGRQNRHSIIWGNAQMIKPQMMNCLFWRPDFSDFTWLTSTRRNIKGSYKWSLAHTGRFSLCFTITLILFHRHLEQTVIFSWYVFPLTI